MTPEWICSTKLTDEQAAVFYLGQEGILLKYRNQTLVIDPYLTDYVDRNCATEAVPWKRLYPAPLCPEGLSFTNFVLCTHPHFDHADPDTLSRLAAASTGVRFIAPAPMRDSMLSYGIPRDRLTEAIADVPITCGEFTVVPVPAAHEELHQDSEGRYEEVGYIVLMGDLRIFHAGDCCIYDGLEERIRGTDAMFLPINGRSYFKNREDIIGNMTAEEAISLASRTEAGMLVPLHHDLYAVNGVNPAIFVDMITAYAPSLRYHIFKPGERYILCR